MEFVDLVIIFKPYISAAFLGLTFAWMKYRSDILDPSKPTPLKFDWEKASITAFIAMVVAVAFQTIGTTLNLTELEAYYGFAAGLMTPFVQPPIKAVYRRLSVIVDFWGREA
jgi:hypothetical protein